MYDRFSKPTLRLFQIKEILTAGVVFIARGNPKYK
jgi:hypothetical protein